LQCFHNRFIVTGEPRQGKGAQPGRTG
jgi:hypothetical protein